MSGKHKSIGTVSAFLALVFAFHLSAIEPQARELVQFQAAVSPPTPFKIKQANKQGIDLKPAVGIALTGFLMIPKGEGPFPAIVLLHGCGGIWRWNEVWSKRLVEWGYVVLDVDSFGPRGKVSICRNPWQIPSHLRALDAHGAKTFLAKLPQVDPDRIAVMGMSHGGWGPLQAVDKTSNLKFQQTPFKAAVALYPWCEDFRELDAPLLILIGELDNWTPSQRCHRFANGVVNQNFIRLTIYPSAHHVFDLGGVDEAFEDYIMRFNPKAAVDAIDQVKAFLQNYL